MDETLQQIQQLSNERHKLWTLMGNGAGTPQHRERTQQITNQLERLWDQYRRELVSATAASRTKQVKAA